MKNLQAVLERLLPALVMALGVTLLTAGLLSYAPSAFGEWHTDAPPVAGDPRLGTPAPDASPATPGATTGARPIPTFNLRPNDGPGALPSEPASTDRPSGTASPTAPPATETPRPARTPRPDGAAAASRIRIPSLSIDLPVVPGDLVVRGNRDFYPLCDVAMFMREFVQPGEIGATYIYGHAQRGMFLPLLRASQTNDGRSMIGALVEVFTSDNRLHVYEIYRVKRHATDLSLAISRPGEHILVLQTSEGTSGHIPKLQVAARPLTVLSATGAEANPRPQPRVCLPR